MAKMKGGELIAEYLVQAEGAVRLRHLRPRQRRHPRPALRSVRDKLKLVSPRHEQCAGHMADGYFRVKHQPVATLTSTGPGSANLVMSLATALSDSSAFLAITSNVPTSQANRAPFQEIYKHNQSDFPSGAAPGGQARVPAHARGHAAARAAPGLRHHGHRPARAGEPRRALQRVPGRGRRRAAAAYRTCIGAAPARRF